MIEKDEDGNPIRAYHLTPDELRRAYQEPAFNDVFARLAATRLAMLRDQMKREAQREEEDNYAG